MVRFKGIKGVLALLGIYSVCKNRQHWFFFRLISPTNRCYYSKALNKGPKVDQSTFLNRDSKKQKDSLVVLLTEKVTRQTISLFWQDLGYMEYLSLQKLAGSICCIHRIYYFRRPFARLHTIFPLKTMKWKPLPVLPYCFLRCFTGNWVTSLIDVITWGQIFWSGLVKPVSCAATDQSTASTTGIRGRDTTDLILLILALGSRRQNLCGI